MHLQTRSITAFKCISRLARSRPTRSHVHGLQVHISKLVQSWPPSASPNSLDHGLQVYLQTRSITACKFARSWPPSASPNSLNLSLHVHIQTRSFTASKCISDFTRSQSPGAYPQSRRPSESLSSLDLRLHVPLKHARSSTSSTGDGGCTEIPV